MKNEEIQRLTITIDELSHALGVRRHAILQHRAGVRSHSLLAGLPEPAANRPRLVWWRRDIEAWVSSRLTFRPSDPAAQPEPSELQPARRGRGRPRKYAVPAGEGGAQ
jgi:hypothetical protein